jgi:HSP20 family protein
MLNMTRHTPWTELAGLHRDLDAIFGREFSENVSSTRESFAPAADVRREGDQWLISIAIPGVSPDNFDIDVVGRTVRVRGERPWDEQKTPPIVSEIRYGRFEREFTLPEEIDGQHVQATHRHGMLELVLPLNESAKPRRIAVTTTPEGKQLQTA